MGFIDKIFKSNAHSTRRASTKKTAAFASELQESSESLSAAANQQAAAIQETVSSIAEMRSMLNQTGEEVQKSLEIASNAITQGAESTRSVNTLNEAMQSISETKNQLQEIRNIFKSIELKTKVINDIVLKTQILSFNASIEAARAGKFGKGFSVVADQVGRLAQTSGKAAKEIDRLLKDSNTVVDSVVESVLSRVEIATAISGRVFKTSTSLSEAVNKISESLTQVGRASNEQLQGIEQTAKALEQIDVATNENRMSAEKIAQIAFEAKNLQIEDSPKSIRKNMSKKIEPTSNDKKDATAEIHNLIESINKSKMSDVASKPAMDLRLIDANDPSFKPSDK